MHIREIMDRIPFLLSCVWYLLTFSSRVKYTFIYGVSNFKATNEEALHKDNILLLWTYRKSCIYTSPFSILKLILNISYNIYVITRYYVITNFLLNELPFKIFYLSVIYYVNANITVHIEMLFDVQKSIIQWITWSSSEDVKTNIAYVAKILLQIFALRL